jgi:hypothetical protein
MTAKDPNGASPNAGRSWTAGRLLPGNAAGRNQDGGKRIRARASPTKVPATWSAKGEVTNDEPRYRVLRVGWNSREIVEIVGRDRQ